MVAKTMSFGDQLVADLRSSQGTNADLLLSQGAADPRASRGLVADLGFHRGATTGELRSSTGAADPRASRGLVADLRFHRGATTGELRSSTGTADARSSRSDLRSSRGTASSLRASRGTTNPDLRSSAGSRFEPDSPSSSSWGRASGDVSEEADGNCVTRALHRAYHTAGGLCMACSLGIYTCWCGLQWLLGKVTEYTIVFIGDVLFRFLTGIWMIWMGLHTLGFSMCLFSLVPGWPFAVFDASEGHWRRFMVAFVGCHHIQEYEGFAASPEIDLVATVFSALPAMSIVSMAGVEGRDVLLTGGEENDFTKAWMALVAMLAGLSISRATSKCVQASPRLRKGATRNYLEKMEQNVSGAIDSVLDRGLHAFTHAIDAVTLVAVVGLMGGEYDQSRFLAWVTFFWLLCGVLPALVAPPPMPTWRDPSGNSMPSWSNGCFVFGAHRLMVSVLLTACPPISYLEILDENSRFVWAFAALLRSVYLVCSAFVAQVQPHLGSVFTVLMCIGACQTAMWAGGKLLLIRRRDLQSVERFRQASRWLLDDGSDVSPACSRPPRAPAAAPIVKVPVLAGKVPVTASVRDARSSRWSFKTVCTSPAEDSLLSF